MAEWLSLIRVYCFFYPPPPLYRGRGTCETGSGRFHDHPNSLLVFTRWPPPPRNILNLQWWGSVLASLSPLLSPHLSHSLWLCPHLWHLTVAQWQPVVRSVAFLPLPFLHLPGVPCTSTMWLQWLPPFLYLASGGTWCVASAGNVGLFVGKLIPVCLFVF